MTDCNTSPLVFSSLGRKKIQADFKGGQLTSDAEAFIASHTAEPDELILDFDPTDDPVHGNQWLGHPIGREAILSRLLRSLLFSAIVRVL